jgi:two-component system LytT family response regulator
MLALVVDDEKRARETICKIIELYTPSITTVMEAATVKEAVLAIRLHKPSLVFLDIRLEDGNGFDVLEQVKDMDLNVIFITAYNEYALKALKMSAIDYILKPIDPEEFVEAVSKALSQIAKNKMEERIDLFLQNINAKETSVAINKITLKTLDNIHIVKIADIIYCQADRNYTTFYLLGGEKIIVSKNLREYEELLPKGGFMRPHQSYLVNLNHIIRYEKGDSHLLVCSEECNVPVSLRKREQVVKVLSNIK